MKTVVLRGGPSGEHEVSLETGENFLRNMPEHCEVCDVLIDRDGTWHMDGREIDPARAMYLSDVVVIALHGTYGEDGTVQKDLENAGVRFIGSGSIESRLAMNKRETNRILSELDVKIPRSIVIPPEEELGLATARVYNKLPMPCIIKPLASGSSLGVTRADRKMLIEEGIREARQYGDYVLVEEYIDGREASCGVIENFREEDLYVLPEIEIIPSATFFDYDAKYKGGTKEVCPGRFSQEEKKEIARIAQTAHNALGLRHYSRTDVIVTPNRGIYFLEVNTLPGFAKESLFPKELEAIGSSVKEFIGHLINLSAPPLK